jgi:hypothetical protein
MAQVVALTLAGMWLLNHVLAPIEAKFLCRATGVASLSYPQAGFGVRIVCNPAQPATIERAATRPPDRIGPLQRTAA